MNALDQPAGATALRVDGMNCGNCARKVTGVIREFAGVGAVDVSVEKQHASIVWDTATPDIDGIIRAINAAGYKATLIDQSSAEPEQRAAGWQSGLSVAAGCTAVLMVGQWVLGLEEANWFRWASFILAGVVQVYSGGRFYQGAWRQLKVRSSNMDTLVALGSTTAFAYSAWALFAGWPGHLYFLEAAAIITLISVGHWMEARVSAKASDSLKALMSLAPQMARRQKADGTEVEVPVAELQPGHWVVLRPGDTVPTDGEVTEGVSSVDESMLTGESLPVDKVAGATLYAGTTNLNGRLLLKVTATGEATALANIIASVQRAQNSSANIQRLGDKVSSVFVPIVLVVALAAALFWGLAYTQATQAHAWLAQYLWKMPLPETPLAGAFIIAAAVLIIACPCAMGLATPTAIMASANAAARRGILIRDGVALEKAGAITAVVFDKTGTLTHGKPKVVACEILKAPSEGPFAATWAETELKEFAASVGRHSSHPFSQAVAQVGEGKFQMSQWSEIRGAGVQARMPRDIGELSLRLGSLRWLRKASHGHEPGKAFVERWSNQGASVIGLAVDERLAALFAIQDELKPGAADVVRKLADSGLKVLMVTGDRKPTALSLARQAGISETAVHAGVRPEQKSEFIQELQKAGERVAFVGDGINDAPALEQAHLGVAVGRASDIAREAADIVLMKSEIEAVPESFAMARATLTTIKQNLFWAFFYNAAAVPLAALGFLSPVLCAAAMGVSDLVVIGNALRLRSRSWRR